MTKNLRSTFATMLSTQEEAGVYGHVDHCHVIPARIRGPTRTVTHQVKPRLFIWHRGDREATEYVPTSKYRYHLEEALDFDFMMEPVPVQSLTIDDNLTATVVLPKKWDRDISLQPVSWVNGTDAYRLEFEDVRL